MRRASTSPDGTSRLAWLAILHWLSSLKILIIMDGKDNNYCGVIYLSTMRRNIVFCDLSERAQALR